MGLDTSHGCWHGAYSAFMRWRRKLAELIGIPLMQMDGFWDGGDHSGGELMQKALEWAAPRDGGPLCGDPYGPLLHGFCTDILALLPFKWEHFRPDPLHALLNHSDCDGEIAAEDCGPIAARLEELMPRLPEGSGGGHIGDWREKTQTFIDGLRLAAEAGEPVVFR